MDGGHGEYVASLDALPLRSNEYVGDGMGFEDGENVEWVMNAVLRGVKEPWLASLYQVCSYLIH